MNSHASSIENEISATPPAWHAAIGLVAGITGAGIAVWSSLQEQPMGIAVGTVFCLLAVYALIDTLTTRLWISEDRLYVRDRVLRVRDFALDGVESVTFVPDELFEIHLAANRRVRFPAGAKGLDRLFQRLVMHVESEEAQREQLD
jgi:hypothetical protein